MSDVCQPFDLTPPAEALFDPKKTAIVSNGRCASSCSLFSITMAKEEGAKTVVLGGKKGIEQRYCGTVGGQSTDFSEIDTEVKVRTPDVATVSGKIAIVVDTFGFVDDAAQEQQPCSA